MRHKLNNIVQRNGVNIYDFFQRFTKLARTSYTIEELNSDLVKTLLKNSFIYGILDKNTAEKILKPQSANLESAYELASVDQKLSQMFVIFHKAQTHIPMEVDAVWPNNESESNQPIPVKSDLMSREELDSKLATLTQAIAHIDTHKLQTNNGVNNRYNSQYSRTVLDVIDMLVIIEAIWRIVGNVREHKTNQACNKRDSNPPP